MLERTYEYRLYPTSEQEKTFALISDTTRALYNRMLKDRTSHFQETGSWKRLDPEPFVKESLLMRDLEVSIVSWTVCRLEKAYANFFHIQKTKLDRYRQDSLKKKEEDPSYKLMDTDLVGYPLMKNKSSKESWDIGPSNVLIMNNRIQVPGVGNIKLRIHRSIPAGAKIQYYTLLKKASGKYFLLVHLQIPEQKPKEEMEKAIGIALDPGKLAQCSDERPVMFRHQEPAQQNRINHAYEKLMRKTPGSRQYEKQRRYLAGLYEKRVNQRRDSLHKISRSIVDKADFIAIEEPMVMRKKKRLLKTGIFRVVQDEAWWTFSEYLKYKSKQAGKQFWRASGALPVRYACSVCGVIEEHSQREPVWCCRYCGAQMPSALNAAKNLEHFGAQYIQEARELNRQ